MPTTEAARRTGVPGRRMIAVVVMVPLLAALALWAFAWPAARIAPRDLPIGVAGPAQAAAELQHKLDQRDGAFDVHRYKDEPAAREAIKDRDVYGAVVVTSGGSKLLTASAASPVVAQLLQTAVADQASQGTEPRTVDVVSAPAADPRGSVLGSSTLPMALAGAVAGVLATMVRRHGGHALPILVGVPVLAGLTSAAIADSWLGILTGNWWAEAGALGLTVLASGAAVAGLAALLGRPGLALGSLLVVLLGNPWSGVTGGVAPELLPEPVGVIGQWLPPGAGGTLVRSIAFFDGHGADAATAVLAAWAVLGLAAVALACLKGRRVAAGRRAEVAVAAAVG